MKTDKQATADDPARRHVLRAGCASVAMMALVAGGLLRPTRVLAAEWQRNAFTATTFAGALQAYAAANSTESREIVFTAPDIAENGAQVVIEIASNLPGSQSIAIFAEKNPMPLAAVVHFANGALPQVRIPLKLAETMRLRAVVKTADGKIWHAQREIRVTLGGCAG
ncbi:MAG TPA: thiosulfate oxidation carrier protein SoxY [Azospira sp.]|nr:thiosulfate oxidation carrier protein SoxY [Azospira sp.]